MHAERIHTHRMKRIRIPFLLIVSSMLSTTFCSCASQYSDYSFLVSFHQPEWLSFTANTYIVRGSKKLNDYGSWRVIVHTADTNQMVVLLKDNEAYRITKDSVQYVDKRYKEIATYHNIYDQITDDGLTFYMVLAGDALQGALELLPMYYDKLGFSVVSLPDDPAMCGKTNEGSRILVRASLSQKICTDKQCYIIDTPMELYYNCKNGFFDSASAKLPLSIRRKKVCKLKDIDTTYRYGHLIDSIFDFSSRTYHDYAYSNSSYLLSRQATSNVEMNDSILDYPLINISSGDTATLRELEGWTLIQLMEYYDSCSNDLIQEAMQFSDEIDNIVCIMTHDDGIEKYQSIAKRNNWPGTVYCGKGLHKFLSNYAACYYLISPQKETVYKLDDWFFNHREKKKIRKIISK